MEGWEVFTGVPHESVSVEGFPQSTSTDSREGTPVGLGDPKKIFATEMQDGKPVLHVSGEIYAGISTKEEFSNYHLSLEFKWGEKKWPPRLHAKRDAGLLVHCTGDHGAFWNVWLRSLECQIQEGDCGDFIALAGTGAVIRVADADESEKNPLHQADGESTAVGNGTGKWGSRHFGDHEKKDSWNTIEVFTVGDKTVFCVNGNAVMHLDKTRVGNQNNGTPLTSGRIQLQSEAAEVFYKNLRIKSITELPAAHAAHFEQ